MRIGIVTTLQYVGWGGSEELWADAADLALDEGHEVVVSTYALPDAAQRLKNLEERGAKIFRHRPAYRPFVSRNIQRVAEKVLGSKEYFPVQKKSPFRHFFAEKPEVVCVNQGDAYSFLTLPDLIEYCDLTQIPVVAVCQAAINHQALYDDDRKRMRDFYGSAYKVVFVAEENLKTVERQMAAPLPNGIVLRNPVNLKTPEIPGWHDNGTVHMASVARLEVINKGQDILFEILGGPSWRERDWKLNLYGTGPHENYLRKLTQFYGIDDRVNFAGQVSDIRSVWAQNHVLLMPSRIEGTPLSMVEAMLSGRACVVSDIAGMTEWITEGDTGFVAEAPSPRSFGAALERAWTARDRWREMGESAYTFAMENYNREPGKPLLAILKEAAAVRK